MAKRFKWTQIASIGAGVIFLGAAIRGYSISSDNNIVGLMLAAGISLALVVNGFRRTEKVSDSHSEGQLPTETEKSNSPAVMATTSQPEESNQQHQSTPEIVLSVLRRTGYACLVIWPAFLLASFMGFDAPGSEKKITPWLVVGFALLMPLLIFVMPRLATRALENSRIKLAYALAIVPIAPFVLPFAIHIWLLLPLSG